MRLYEFTEEEELIEFPLEGVDADVLDKVKEENESA